MDTGSISQQVLIQLEGRKTIGFNYGFPPCDEIIQEYLRNRKKIVGIQLSYSRYFTAHGRCSEQSMGIEPLKYAFGAKTDGTITKVPHEFTLDTQDGIHILKCGPREIPPAAIKAAEESGISGVWDNEDLIILAREEYKELLEKILDFIEPFKVRLQLGSYLGGSNLMIVCI